MGLIRIHDPVVEIDEGGPCVRGGIAQGVVFTGPFVEITVVAGNVAGPLVERDGLVGVQERIEFPQLGFDVRKQRLIIDGREDFGEGAAGFVTLVLVPCTASAEVIDEFGFAGFDTGFTATGTDLNLEVAIFTGEADGGTLDYVEDEAVAGFLEVMFEEKFVEPRLGGPAIARQDAGDVSACDLVVPNPVGIVGGIVDNAVEGAGDPDTGGQGDGQVFLPGDEDVVGVGGKPFPQDVGDGEGLGPRVFDELDTGGVVPEGILARFDLLVEERYHLILVCFGYVDVLRTAVEYTVGEGADGERLGEGGTLGLESELVNVQTFSFATHPTVETGLVDRRGEEGVMGQGRIGGGHRDVLCSGHIQKGARPHPVRDRILLRGG